LSSTPRACRIGPRFRNRAFASCGCIRRPRNNYRPTPSQNPLPGIRISSGSTILGKTTAITWSQSKPLSPRETASSAQNLAPPMRWSKTLTVGYGSTNGACTSPKHCTSSRLLQQGITLSIPSSAPLSLTLT
jgi:hypothetical protein